MKILTTRTMHLGLIGNYGATNIGDEAILESILKSHPAHTFTVFSANPADTHERHGIDSAPLFPCGIRSFLKNGFRPSREAMEKIQAVVLGGGGLFQDDRPFACLLWAWQVGWVKRLKKPLFIYATGVGPLTTRWGKALTRYAYSYAQSITVRDAASAQLLENLGIEKSKINITNDPVFLFEPSKAIQERTKNLFMILIRPWKDAKILDTLAKFLKWLKESQNARFIIVSMQRIKESDDTLATQLAQKLDEQIFCPKNFSELMHRMAECEGAIGMRYHFCLAAFLTKTPCLGLSYSPKVSALFKDVPDQCLDLQGVSEEKLKHAWQAIQRDQERIQKREGGIVGQNRIQAQKNKTLLEQFLKNI